MYTYYVKDLKCFQNLFLTFFKLYMIKNKILLDNKQKQYYYNHR